MRCVNNVFRTIGALFRMVHGCFSLMVMIVSLLDSAVELGGSGMRKLPCGFAEVNR